MAGEYYKIQSEIRTNIKDFLEAEGYAVQLENDDDFEKPDDVAWARITLIDGVSEIICIGASKTYRQVFVAEVQVFSPAGSDQQAVEKVVSLVMEEYAFKNIQEATTGAVAKFQAPSASLISRVGGQWQKNGVLPYQVDFIKTA